MVRPLNAKLIKINNETIGMEVSAAFQMILDCSMAGARLFLPDLTRRAPQRAWGQKCNR